MTTSRKCSAPGKRDWDEPSRERKKRRGGDASAPDPWDDDADDDRDDRRRDRHRPRPRRGRRDDDESE